MTPTNSSVRLAPALAIFLLLSFSGCGGGSSGGGGGGSGGGGSSGDSSDGGGGNLIEEPATYTVTTEVGEGGSISPPTADVEESETASFAVLADSGYLVASVTGCDGTLDDETYTTGNVTADCKVTAVFEAEPTVVELLDGTYKGVLVSPKNNFFTSGVDVTFSTNDGETSITKEAFSGRTCNLEGELTGDGYPLAGTGTFDCSDFTTGTWSTDMIAKTDALALFAKIHMDPDDGDAYTIRVSGFRSEVPLTYDQALSHSRNDAKIEDFTGTFDGRLQSFDSCAALDFSNSPTDLTIAIDEGQIQIEQDAFFEGVCEYEGTIQSFEEGVISAAGTFKCSNFDEGTWSTDRLVMTGLNSMFAELAVGVPSRGCDYSIRYLGFADRDTANGGEPTDEPTFDTEPELVLERCGFMGCNEVSLPFNSTTTLSLNVVPDPEWYTLAEFRITAGSSDAVISNIRAEVISGPAEHARIDGLTEMTLTAGEQLSFELQSSRTQQASVIEFSFDVENTPGDPSTFFNEVTVTTN